MRKLQKQLGETSLFSPPPAGAPTPWGTGTRDPQFYKWLGTGRHRE